MVVGKADNLPSLGACAVVPSVELLVAYQGRLVEALAAHNHLLEAAWLVCHRRLAGQLETLLGCLAYRRFQILGFPAQEGSLVPLISLFCAPGLG